VEWAGEAKLLEGLEAELRNWSMPAITCPEYVQHITDLLNHAVAIGEAVLRTLQVDQQSIVRGLIAGI
jgi:hypothetical protein